MWKDSYVYFLVEKVHKSPYIWDTNDVLHKNKLKKYSFWENLADEMNEEFKPKTPFDKDSILKKWSNLRTYNTVETQKIVKAKESGAGAEELREIKNSWKFGSILEFLTTTAQPTLSVKNVNKRKLQAVNNYATDSSEMSEFSSTSIAPCSADVSNFDFECEKPTIKIELNEELSPPMLRQKDTTSINCTASTSQRVQKCKQSFTVDSRAETPFRQQNEITSPLLSNDETSITHGTQHMHKNKRVMKETCNQAMANSVVMASKPLTDVTTAPPANKPMSLFAACVDEELSLLDPDLKIHGKNKIFQIITDLQLQQLQRNKQN